MSGPFVTKPLACVHLRSILYHQYTTHTINTLVELILVERYCGLWSIDFLLPLHARKQTLLDTRER